MLWISKAHGPAIMEAFLQQGNRLIEPTKRIFWCNSRERSVGGIAMPVLELAGTQRITTLTHLLQKTKPTWTWPTGNESRFNNMQLLMFPH